MLSPKLFARYSVRLHELIGKRGGLLPGWVAEQWQQGLRLDLGYERPS